MKNKNVANTQDACNRMEIANHSGKILKMPDPLRQQYEVITEHWARMSEDEATHKMAIGVIVYEIQQDANKYGAKAVPTLAKTLQVSEALLYGLGRVARFFTPDEAQKWVSTRDKVRNQPLTMSHLMEAAAVADDAERNQLLADCVENGWSVKAMAASRRSKQEKEFAKSHQLSPLARPIKTIEAFKEGLRHWDGEELVRELSEYHADDAVGFRTEWLDFHDRLGEVEDQLSDICQMIASVEIPADLVHAEDPDEGLGAADASITTEQEVQHV